MLYTKIKVKICVNFGNNSNKKKEEAPARYLLLYANKLSETPIWEKAKAHREKKQKIVKNVVPKFFWARFFLKNKKNTKGDNGSLILLKELK